MQDMRLNPVLAALWALALPGLEPGGSLVGLANAAPFPGLGGSSSSPSAGFSVGGLMRRALKLSFFGARSPLPDNVGGGGARAASNALANLVARSDDASASSAAADASAPGAGANDTAVMSANATSGNSTNSSSSSISISSGSGSSGGVGSHYEWIGGAVAIFVLLGIAVGVYFFAKRKSRMAATKGDRGNSENMDNETEYQESVDSGHKKSNGLAPAVEEVTEETYDEEDETVKGETEEEEGEKTEKKDEVQGSEKEMSTAKKAGSEKKEMSTAKKAGSESEKKKTHHHHHHEEEEEESS